MNNIFVIFRKNILILENFLELYFDLPINSLRDKVGFSDSDRDLSVEFRDNTLNIEIKSKDILVNKDVLNVASVLNMKRTIQINFNDVNEDKVIERWYLTNEKTLEKMDILEIDIVDLLKGKKRNKQRFDVWCGILLANNMMEIDKYLKRLDMDNSLKVELRKELVSCF